MMDMAEEKNVFENYLKLLNLRLFTILERCPAETRTEALKWINETIEPSQETVPVISEQDLIKCAKLSEEYTEEQSELLSRAKELGQLPRLMQLQRSFDLSGNEMVILTAVLAGSVDERFRRLFELYQNSEEPRMDLLLSLIDPEGMNRYAYAELLTSEGKLLSRRLIEAVNGVKDPVPLTAFRPGPGLLSWLNGTRSAALFHGAAEWVEIAHSEDGLFEEYGPTADAILSAEIDGEPLPLVSFYGPDLERLLRAAKVLAADLDRDVLKLDFSGVEESGIIPLLNLALRDAVLNRGMVVLAGINSWIDSGGIFPAQVGRVLENWNVPVVLLTNRSFVFSHNELQEKRLLLRLSVEGLTGTRRFSVWKDRLNGLPADESVTDDTVRTLAGQFILNSVQIRAAVNFGLGKAVTEGRDLAITDLYEGARKSSMHHLSDLAKQMTARYTLRDLILPPKQAGEIDALIAMARNRSLVLEDWGIGKKLVSGRGISALFTGVPGTGKTLSAQAIAGELGLDLYRVDLSTVVSKYIGETEKNLERIFTEAQNSNVILFFDEADSLFGRRSEVGDSHDRYANIEVGYLLQRIEVYDGIVLMATNLGANLDEAFARRIHFIIDFPFPDEETRLRLWELLLPANVEKEENIDLRPFAAAYKIAGGGIRNAVVWAVYEAARHKRPLSRDDLLHGVEREYQKMGKVFIALR